MMLLDRGSQPLLFPLHTVLPLRHSDGCCGSPFGFETLVFFEGPADCSGSNCCVAVVREDGSPGEGHDDSNGMTDVEEGGVAKAHKNHMAASIVLDASTLTDIRLDVRVRHTAVSVNQAAVINVWTARENVAVDVSAVTMTSFPIIASRIQTALL